MSDPINLNFERADREDDNTCLTPEDVLRQALIDLENGTIKANSAIVILIDDDPENDGGKSYRMSYLLARLKTSQIIGWLEVLKARMLVHMGEVSDGR